MPNEVAINSNASGLGTRLIRILKLFVARNFGPAADAAARPGPTTLCLGTLASEDKGGGSSSNVLERGTAEKATLISRRRIMNKPWSY